MDEQNCVREGEMELINRYSRRTLSEDEIYVFSVTLCDNEIDRDFERFSDEALSSLAPLFEGRTGICDHDPKSANQRARIFSCEAKSDPARKTSDGRAYKYLSARAYMLKTEQNLPLIAEIDAGIKKEVSVGCSVAKKSCSICGGEDCRHIPGKVYETANGEKLCHTILSEPKDAYEWSFVAVPAQRGAGITKSYGKETKKILTAKEIIKSLGEKEINLSAKEGRELSEHIKKLGEKASLGEIYIAEKRGAVARELCELLPAAGEVIKSVVDRMTLFELESFASARERGVSQLSHAADNSKFLI